MTLPFNPLNTKYNITSETLLFFTLVAIFLAFAHQTKGNFHRESMNELMIFELQSTQI